MLTATKELWGYRALVVNLTRRQLKSQYKQSLLGNLWSLINPAATLAVYSLVFGVFLRFGRNVPCIGDADITPTGPPGDQVASCVADGGVQSFPLYLFCALILWSLFNRVAVGSMGQFSSTGGLLRKVYFPPSAPVVAHSLAQIRQALLEGAIAMLVIGVVGGVSWTFLLWPLLIVPMLLFALGLGLVLSLTNAYYKDIGYFVTIVMQLLFYCTPILYNLERIGDTEILGVKATTLIKMNPLTQFVGVSRDLLYIQQMPSLTRVTVITVVSIGSLLVGWWLFVQGSENVSEVV